MRSSRKLTLKRERLTVLTPGQLDGLAAGLAAVEARIVGNTTNTVTPLSTIRKETCTCNDTIVLGGATLVR